jgi:hypothetical protein
VKRESFVHRARNLISIRDLLDFPIPRCSKCEKPMVKFGIKWACKEHTLVDHVSFVQEFMPTVNGPELQARPVVEKVPFGQVYPNRFSRRRAA